MLLLLLLLLLLLFVKMICCAINKWTGNQWIPSVTASACHTAVIFLLLISPSSAWVCRSSTVPRHQQQQHHQQQRPPLHHSKLDSSSEIDFDSLLVMDVVIYRDESTGTSTGTPKLGAMQEDGTIAPLSAWTTESAFGDSIEFVVDEEQRFPGLTSERAKVIQVLAEGAIGYGSRQVGGGKGPGNPHGEESELLYYVDRRVLDGIEFEVNPNLEILW
jgi:hypothetical protein